LESCGSLDLVQILNHLKARDLDKLKIPILHLDHVEINLLGGIEACRNYLRILLVAIENVEKGLGNFVADGQEWFWLNVIRT